MRIALVSPYSWTYPGGVTRHIEALAGQFLSSGHDVRVLAPYDPSDRLAERLHRGAAPEPREAPDYLIPLGRTVGFPANGAVSNLAVTPYAVSTMRRELTAGNFDVIHVHEPVAPYVGWDVLSHTSAPLVGTFHCYSTARATNGTAGTLLGARWRLNRLTERIAVSEAAAWTGRRFYGGRYRVIPNGVDVPAEPLALHTGHADDGLHVVFVGQAVERKGLPILLRAFEALREHVPARLTIVGAGHEDVAPILDDLRGVTALGKVDDATKIAVLRSADVLAAPSLGGESFGMVLTEAFAAGTPVVASDIAGYQDVVRHDVDGLLVPRGDAVALAAALRELALDPARRRAMGAAAAEHAQRYSWSRVATEVLETYEDAIARPEPVTLPQRVGVRVGAIPADLGPRVPARRLASMEPAPPQGAPRRGAVLARRAALAVATVGGVGLAAMALQRIGVERVSASLLDSSPTWVLVALGLMCLSMVVRAVSWTAILRAALPDTPARYADAMQGTFIGVLMSATLPARLGEPARAMIVARRLGSARGTLPAVVGTLVSQTLLNILALVILGIVMFSSVGYFRGNQSALVLFTVAPLVVLLVVLAAPALLRGGLPSRSKRIETFLLKARGALVQVRGGLAVFRRPRAAAIATSAQLTAWVIQWIACYVLLVAFGLDGEAGIGAAAAVLFAVNVTAVLPATPSNLGVFQAACVAVLSGAYGVSYADALGYGLVLQAVEIATAIIMGAPALVKEGVSWGDVRMRAMHATPVELPPLPHYARKGETLEFEV
ncbi:glycosyltransferase [Conexibacter sp. W3-3-2]|uniref:Phosphatidylinositol alpha-mannosyltransferase n=1 Tax=Paraconexibacter algicola TaxID=2133960 RepID=A0A2T4UFP3_9ACTN|nr:MULTISPECIES: lysylphosphatidylglycerol synthase domain-containing protein [Solirubrobacterales]MTD44168.1 glycosyltransferase [Conexibacter sp. W3-3-2]PTL56591.1 phosphatidylinositol alpha-mannosyltransferase [Paraconexibacter algicola]